MSAFTFRTITAAQASAYDAAADSLTFEEALASRIAVGFLPDQIAVTLDGRTVAFGPGVAGDGDLTAGGGGRLFLGAPGAEVVDGGPGADGFYGGQGADSLDGGEGDDLLHGNQGADLLRGGAGSDVIYGGQGDDLIVTGLGPGEANWAHGNLGNDTINGVGSDVIYGGQGADRITGGQGPGHLNGNLGDDTLQGGDAADTLFGEGGRDLLLGGGGGDVFVFEAGASALLADGADTIGGWELSDRIRLPAFGGYAELSPPPAPGDPYYGGGGPGPPYTFATGLDAARGAAAMDPGLKVVAVQVGADVVVYADADAQPGLDLAVILTGTSLGAIDALNFG